MIKAVLRRVGALMLLNALPLAVIAAVAASDSDAIVDLSTQAMAHLAQGHTKDATLAYQQFNSAFLSRREAKKFEKGVYLSAAKCYLAFGEPLCAADILYEVAVSSVEVPADFAYLLIKSLHAAGVHPLVIRTYTGFKDEMRTGLDGRARQEIMIITADSYAALGKRETTMDLLRSAVQVVPASPLSEVAGKRLEDIQQMGTMVPTVLNPRDNIEAILRSEKCGPYLKKALTKELSRISKNEEGK